MQSDPKVTGKKENNFKNIDSSTMRFSQKCTKRHHSTTLFLYNENLTMFEENMPTLIFLDNAECFYFCYLMD